MPFQPGSFHTIVAIVNHIAEPDTHGISIADCLTVKQVRFCGICFLGFAGCREEGLGLEIQRLRVPVLCRVGVLGFKYYSEVLAGKAQQTLVRMQEKEL